MPIADPIEGCGVADNLGAKQKRPNQKLGRALSLRAALYGLTACEEWFPCGTMAIAVGFWSDG